MDQIHVGSSQKLFTLKNEGTIKVDTAQLLINIRHCRSPIFQISLLKVHIDLLEIASFDMDKHQYNRYRVTNGQLRFRPVCPSFKIYYHKFPVSLFTQTPLAACCQCLESVDHYSQITTRSVLIQAMSSRSTCPEPRS